MNIFKITVLIFLTIFSLIFLSDIEVDNYELEPSIKVEIKGEVDSDKVLEIER